MSFPSPVRFLLLPFLLLFHTGILAGSAFGQQQGGFLNDPRSLDIRSTYNVTQGTAEIIFHVYSERESVRLDRQALLKLVNPATQLAVWQSTDENSEGVFINVAYGHYDVEISAVGFLSTHQSVTVLNSMSPYEYSVVLHRDPEAVNLDFNESVMSPKARKEEKRAIALLKSGNLPKAQKQLDLAYKLAPTSPDLNFLMGYLYYQNKDLEHAANYLGTAVNLNPHNVQALTLLGRTGLERADYPAARSALEQAVLADSENWLPHNLLADAYLHQQNYDKARDEAQVAITKGKQSAASAQLILGQALLGLGDDKEGLQALTAFLEEEPKHPMAPQVRTLIDWVHDRQSHPTVVEASAATHSPDLDPLSALPDPGLKVTAWQPPGIDNVKPVVASGVTCPIGEVLDQSGSRVQELVDDVARFAAVEDLFHQALDRFGVPTRSEDRKYNYVASISETEPGFLNVEEYRSDKSDFSGYPDNIASTGFATLALVFHPHMRDNFDMTCEGLGDWHGQPSWLVHFQQRNDRPNRMHSYKLGDQFYPVALKGRAWITADKFQIVRIEAEMVKPMPEIQLLSEHQVVEYGPVPFPKRNTTLWLPKTAEIYFDFRKHRYYRRHSFDHYMLYSVDTQEKTKAPMPGSGS